MKEREEPNTTSGFLAGMTVDVLPLTEREDGGGSRFRKDKGECSLS